ncbi:Protein unc-13-like protein C [Frankliniella fusca]|uniref:Protein unc-13-like protein C n=1 Tax=Frankliniella fusca TaxID=407009 RepID=A0AAE1LJK9_9NEOP|nr:Protein unc-13-like protein C [Frankliniella fusca]
MAPKKVNTVGEMSSADLQALIAAAVASAVDPLSAKLDKLQKIIELQSEVKLKNDEIERLKQEMNVKFDEREQYSRRNNLRIFGIPESENENTDQLVVDVAKKMGVQLSDSTIDRSHRIGKQGPQPRPIIVKLTRYNTRDEIFRAKRNLKGTGIVVREDLTKLRLKFLKEAVQAYSSKYVWTIDGVIMVKTPKLRYPFRVTDHDSFNTLFDRYPPD